MEDTRDDCVTGERFVPARGAELCVQTFGRADAPGIVLISGLSASMDWWPVDFCTELVAGGRYVIRYDHRDTGRSTSYPAGRPDYTGRDLTEDSLAVIDGLGLRSAHLVGLSAGGGIAQELTLLHPSRVETLTLIDTSPAIGDHDQLPPPIEPVASVLKQPPPDPDWSDRAAVIDHLVETERAFAGDGFFDRDQIRTIAAAVVDRTNDIEAATTNHWIAEPGAPVPGTLGDITVPTLVLHGTLDPLFPYAHGQALAAAIPGARLVPLEYGGHQAPAPALWPTVVGEILDHTG